MVEQEDVAISGTHTPCRNCVFAQYAGNTQSGCALGRIEKFREHGSVLEVYDGGKEFFVINGRLCNAYQDQDSDFARQVKPEHRVETMRRMLRLHMDVIVVLENECSDAWAPLLKLKDQRLKPSQVVIVNNSDLPPAKVIASTRANAGDLNWKLVDVRERDAQGNRPSRDRCVDLAMPRVSGNYYAVVSPHDGIPENFISDIDAALNERLERFSLLLSDESNVVVVQTAVHTRPLINGNTPMVAETEQGSLLLKNVVEKIRHYAKLQDKEFLVADLNSVVRER